MRPSRTPITSTPWFSHGSPAAVVAVSSQMQQPTSPSTNSSLMRKSTSRSSPPANAMNRRAAGSP